ncbi:hypothetical protein POWCR01_000173100 [Plasmodium ovale]|uniref:PIR protein n=1 Tax=Plasmodium ovale TaxID=36330 RepID=A0A1C3KJE4_PLAOA|nr:hypothetical protein POWCR01_000173100 [Plasmodium ovale]
MGIRNEYSEISNTTERLESIGKNPQVNFTCRRVSYRNDKISDIIECKDEQEGDIKALDLLSSSNFSYNNIINNTGLALLGALFILLLLYKFASSGSFTHKRKQKKENILYSSHENIMNILNEHESETVHMNSNNRRLRSRTEFINTSEVIKINKKNFMHVILESIIIKINYNENIQNMIRNDLSYIPFC